jgi:hypothetical protein
MTNDPRLPLYVRGSFYFAYGIIATDSHAHPNGVYLLVIEYIKESELDKIFNDAVKYMEPHFRPLKEFERIARNRPHPGIASHLPKVTDGTLAGLIQETPKRIIQQIPSGKVKSDNEWLNIVGGFIFENEILPNSDYVHELIQKCWALTSKALTYGGQPAFVKFIQNGEYFGTDFTLPYITDVLLEPGKLSDKDSNVIFMRAWYQPRDIDCIIQKEKDLAKSAKERDEKYDSPWDITELEKARDKFTSKDSLSRTPNEEAKGSDAGGVEIIHVFQRGIGGMFYSFSTATKGIVRRKTNKDPRGAVPIHFMYANVDFSNPIGRGSVEMSGGLQNLLDSEVQAYQWKRILEMDGPVIMRGSTINPASIKNKAGAKWDLGADPNAMVEPVKYSTTSLEQFPQNYGLIKSQILNLNNSLDTSVSAEAGNPGYSKTPAGIQANEQKLGVSDNYIRQQFEHTFQEIAETELNLWFAERQGTQELQLDKDTARKLRKLEPEGVSQDNKIRIDYATETEKLQFHVDPTTSNKKDDVAERDRLIELLDLSGKYPVIAELMGQDGTKELVNRIVVTSGVQDPEKIIPTGEEDKVDANGQPIEQPNQNQMTPEMVQQMIQEAMQAQPQTDPVIERMKALGIKYADLPEDAKQQVLEELGITGQALSPRQQEIDIKKFQAAESAAGPSDVELDHQTEQNIQKAEQMERQPEPQYG